LSILGHTNEGYKPNNCKICGHYSHCGQPLWLENKGYPQDGNNFFKACHNCNCKICNKGESND